MWQDLLQRQFRSLSPQDAADLAAGDWVLVDVRPKEEFEKATIEGAVNVPLFQSMDFSQATPQSYLRAAAYWFNGVKPVEPNPKFEEQMKTQTAGKKAILFCETGGTMKPSPNFSTGKTSRSLKAAWLAATKSLAPDVAHLEGGIFGWYQAKLPMTGEYDTSNVGRTPNAAPEPTLPTSAEK